jgi:uncharacterized zinc-type alcohol dehydrogenase-like protein
MGRKCIVGSLIRGLNAPNSFNIFCKEHNITSDVVLINVEEINITFERIARKEFNTGL